jgi:phosphotransferase system HPr (HPr) family protein
VSREVVVPLQHGIHARPAARIAESARKFASEVALVAVNRRASAKSPVGVMSLADPAWRPHQRRGLGPTPTSRSPRSSS